MPVSMSDCKKKDNWAKRLCATLWFEVKSAPFPLMAEPPSGNKNKGTRKQGRFPDRAMVALLHSNAFNGDLERNPYAFQKFGVTQV